MEWEVEGVTRLRVKTLRPPAPSQLCTDLLGLVGNNVGTYPQLVCRVRPKKNHNSPLRL